jgi:hypothetical protein
VDNLVADTVPVDSDPIRPSVPKMSGMNTELLSRPILTDADLYRFWTELMNPLGFTRRRLYFVLLDEERRVLRTLHEVDDIPARPTEEGVEGLMTALALVGDDFGIAILLARPGHHPMDADDRAWASGLVDASERFGISLEPIHLANDGCLVPFAEG